MSKQLLLSLKRSFWLIDEQFVNDNIDLVQSFLNGNFDPTIFSALKENNSFYAIDGAINAGSLVTRTRYSSFDNALPGSIAVIKVQGPILKSDNCGDPGSMTQSQFIIDAANHSKIKGTILILDTPGGQVEGTQTAADAVAYHASKKPIISFVQDGMMASAGYWLGAAATKIIASHNTCMIGSIGVMAKLADSATQPKAHIIYADQSSEKNKDFQDAMGGKYDALRQNILNPLAENFIGAIQAARSSKINLKAGDPYKGKLYMAYEALNIGLIDSIGTLEDCIAAIDENISERGTDPNYHSTNNNLNITMKKVSILSIFSSLWGSLGGKLEVGKEEVEIEMTIQKQQELNAKLETISALEAKASDFESKLNTANTALTAANLITAKYTDAQKAILAKEDATAEEISAVDVLASITTLKGKAAVEQPNLHHKGADATDEYAGYTAEEKALLTSKV